MKQTMKWIVVLTLALVLVFCNGIGTAEFEETEIDPSLILYLSFDNSLLDEAQNVDLDVCGDVTMVEGHDGTKGAYFDGDGDYLALGKGFNFDGDFTISLWVKSDSGDRSDAALFAKYETNHYGPYDFYLAYNHPTIWLSDGKGGHMELMSETAIDDDWHFLAFTYEKESNTYTIYIDGEQCESWVMTFDMYYNDDSVTIGRQALQFSPYNMLQFKGSLDEIRVYNRCLDEVELQMNYSR